MVSRNAPCPCGSGRKHKHCCLARESTPPPYTQEQRKAVLSRLQAFLDSAEMQIAREAALEEYWGPLHAVREDLRDPLLKSISRDAFDAWFAYDWLLDDGRAPAEHFLDAHPVPGTGAREYLSQALASSMRLYEITRIVPEISLALRDLLSGREWVVRERSGTRTLRRWDVLAARIMPRAASGWPEMDGGSFCLPRLLREALLEEVRRQLGELRRGNPKADELSLTKTLVPFFHWTWIGPTVAPHLLDLQAAAGHDLGEVRTCFEVLDRGRIAAALDACPDFVAAGDEEQEWLWCGPAGKDGARVVLGRVNLPGERLVLATLSRERAAQGQARLERLAGEALRCRTPVEQHPAQAPAELSRHGPAVSGSGDPDEASPDLQWEVASEAYQRHYRDWIDRKTPALRGHMPREAARSADLRPLLVEMLKDLENSYELALSLGQPGFDPAWMWLELGLEGEPEAPRRPPHPPLTAGEALERFVPGIGKTARTIAAQRRARADFGPGAVIVRRDMESDPIFLGFIEAQGAAHLRTHGDPGNAAAHANLVAAHLLYMINHELHLRKTFWVDEGLAYQLAQTRLDIAGDHLRMPFACFALIFTDRHMLGLLERVLSTDPGCAQHGRKLAVATAYVFEVPAGEAREISISLTCAARNEEWPYLVARDLYVRPEAELESILDSHLPEVDVRTLDPIFTSAPLRRVLHLVINAILYATSPGVKAELRRPPQRRARSSPTRGTPELPLSGQEVFFLPGTIDISHLRAMQALERAPGGRGLLHRFMVRGHWRRPARSWKLQHPRWIQPYWKGPDIATVIERAYRLKP